MKCFLFSLNKNKKYSPNLQIQNNIYNCSSHVIEFGNGDAITVFPSLAIQFDVKAGATWFNDPDQEEEHDLAYNYDGDDPLGLLEEMAHTQGKTILIATHNSALARFGDHLLEIKDGRIIKDQQNGKPRKLKDIVW